MNDFKLGTVVKRGRHTGVVTYIGDWGWVVVISEPPIHSKHYEDDYQPSVSYGTRGDPHDGGWVIEHPWIELKHGKVLIGE